jgi:hypothetical protein
MLHSRMLQGSDLHGETERHGILVGAPQCVSKQGRVPGQWSSGWKGAKLSTLGVGVVDQPGVSGTGCANDMSAVP